MALKRLPPDLTFDKLRNQQSPLSAPAPKSSGRSPSETPTDTDTGEDGTGGIAGRPDLAGESPPGGRQERKDPAKTTGVPTRPGVTVPGSSGSQAKTTIKGQLSLPAEGVSPTFEKIKARYGDKVAFKHVLGLALQSYADAILAGDARAIALRQGYERHPTAPRVSPTRSVPTRFYESATAILDPLGIMGPSALGSVIMRTALTWYVDRDRSGT